MEAVKVTIFLTKLKRKGMLALVEYADGTLGIQRDGQAVPDCRWKVGELEQSIDTFRTLARVATEAK